MKNSFGIPTFAAMKRVRQDTDVQNILKMNFSCNFKHFFESNFIRRWTLLGVLLLISFVNIHSQTTSKIFGYITGANGTPLEFVTIFNETKTYTGNGDQDGYYEMILPTDRLLVITFRYQGNEKTIEVNLKPNQRLQKDIQINATQIITGVDIDVTRKREDRGANLSLIIIKDPEQIPSPNPGIEKVLIMEPVNVASELSSAYSVRGGSYDENLVYVNDIQVYRPFLVRSGEQEGLSFPNPDMVSSISFSAGGFEAKYGDKLSSVLDIKYKDPTEFEGAITMSLLGGSFHIANRRLTNADTDKEGYLSSNTGIRYKSNAYLLGSLDTQGAYNPRFVDFQTYITWKPRKFGVIEYNFLGNFSQNKYNFTPESRQTDVGNINEALRFSVAFEGQEQSQFETYFGAFSLKYLASENTLLRLITSAFKTYENEHFDILGRYRLDELERDFGSDEFGEVIRNRGIGAFRDHARNDLEASVVNISHIGSSEINRNNYLEWGIKFQQEKIVDKLSEWTLIDSSGYAVPHANDNPGYEVGERPIQEIEIQDLIKAKNDISSSRITGYIQNTTTIERKDSFKLELNYGFRAHHWSFNNQLVAGPRANLSFRPEWYRNRPRVDSNKVDIVFSLAGGWYYQPAFYKEMRNLDGDINSEIRAQRAIHIVGGANFQFYAWKRPFILKSEIFYKDLSSLIPYEVENVRTRYYATNNSKGYATGLDLMLNGEFINGIESWVRASLLRTEEDILDDSYIEYINTDGDVIIPDYSLNQIVADSNVVHPGYIPRPTDQLFSFSLLFKDEMRKWPEYKVLVSVFYSTGLPYGPPSFERHLDVSRLPAYRRVDIGFSRDFFKKKERKDKNHFFKSGWISLEVFNLLDISNTISFSWIRDVNGRFYGISNHLTSRRINLKLHFDF